MARVGGVGVGMAWTSCCRSILIWGFLVIAGGLLAHFFPPLLPRHGRGMA